MTVEDRLLAKVTIDAYADQEFSEQVGDSWQALLNPSELSFSRKNSFNNEQSAGTSAPQTSYANGEPDEITLELLFDGSGVIEDDKTVKERVDGLLELMAFDPDTHQPLYLHAYWGSWNFLCLMTNAKVTYKVFDRDGEPVRATVAITLMEVISPEVLARMERRQSPDLHQTWLVVAGETIDVIAHRVYGTSAFWRPLAEANGLVNPRELAPGTVLTLPPRAR